MVEAAVLAVFTGPFASSIEFIDNSFSLPSVGVCLLIAFVPASKQEEHHFRL
jgi:hypothetical protein